jgi:glycosyltransferase involved in cell wall biosynthesis
LSRRKERVARKVLKGCPHLPFIPFVRLLQIEFAPVTHPIILNLLPITKGGGLQNTLSFLEMLSADSKRKKDVAIVCREGTSVADFCRERFRSVENIKNTLPSRFRTELFGLTTLSRGLNSNLCLTLFGAPAFGYRGRMLNVIGCAYSNLFYPEIDFWGYLRGTGLYRKFAIDAFRKFSLKKADFWVFETETLRNRAIRQFQFPPDRVEVVKTAPSASVSKPEVSPEKVAHFKKTLPGEFRVLLLAGAHPNKQQILIPKFLERLRSSGGQNISFVTTMNPHDPYAQSVISEVKRIGGIDSFTNLGQVPSKDLASLIEACDAMLCCSRLESFSNNFIEAWNMDRPLIVTEADWSRDSCGDGAVYLDLSSLKDSAQAIQKVASSESFRDRLVHEGRIRLRTYNTPLSKYEDYWRVLARAQNAGACPHDERRKILL